jgi:hypothetical protein
MDEFVAVKTPTLHTSKQFAQNLPVLSEQMTVTLPSVTTAGSLRMIALCLAMLATYHEYVTVTIDVRPSGTIATAHIISMGTDSPVRAASWHARLLTLSMRMSAGTCIKDDNVAGDHFAGGTLISFPSRTTAESLESMFLRASAAFLAQPSW